MKLLNFTVYVKILILTKIVMRHKINLNKNDKKQLISVLIKIKILILNQNNLALILK
jgi:hypothetical protein